MDGRSAAITSALARKVATAIRALIVIEIGRRELTRDEAMNLERLRQLERDLHELLTLTRLAGQQCRRASSQTLSAFTLALLAEHLPGALAAFQGADRLIAVRGIIALMPAIEPELGATKQPPPFDRGARACLNHLLGAYAAPRRNTDRRTIEQWIEAALSGGAALRQAANAVLGRYGVAVAIDDPPLAGDGSWLYVSNSHRRLGELFAGTLWAPPRRGRAPWSLALRQIEGARVIGVRRFDGQGTRATAIPLDYVIRRREAA